MISLLGREKMQKPNEKKIHRLSPNVLLIPEKNVSAAHPFPYLYLSFHPS